MATMESSMSLVNELQHSAATDDVLTVLRKAKRLSVKLNRPDIVAYIDKELNGYSAGDAIPAYRTVSQNLHYVTNGYIPYGYGHLVNGVLPLNDDLGLSQTLTQPISEILDWISSANGSHDLFFRPSE